MFQYWYNLRIQIYWAPYIVDRVKETFKKRESSYSESNYSSVKEFVIQSVKDIHGTMKKLITRQ